MGELESKYEEEATFTIVPPEETLQAGDQIAQFGFEAMKHGLVILSPDGEALVMMPGHQFGREEIESSLNKVLTAP